MLNFKKLFLGSFMSAALCAALLAAAAFCVQRVGLLPDAVSGTLGLIVGVLSVFCGSIITALWAGEKGLVYGVLLAALFLFLFIVIGFFLCKETDFTSILVRAAAFLISGALGGILGVNRTQHIRF